MIVTGSKPLCPAKSLPPKLVKVDFTAYDGVYFESRK